MTHGARRTPPESRDTRGQRRRPRRATSPPVLGLRPASGTLWPTAAPGLLASRSFPYEPAADHGHWSHQGAGQIRSGDGGIPSGIPAGRSVPAARWDGSPAAPGAVGGPGGHGACHPGGRSCCASPAARMHSSVYCPDLPDRSQRPKFPDSEV